MEDFCWVDDSLNELVNMDIGELREMLAYEDADISFKDFLLNNGWIEENCDCYDDCEDEDEEEEDDDEAELPSDQEDLAEEIADDIIDGKYTIESISGLYSPEFIARVQELI